MAEKRQDVFQGVYAELPRRDRTGAKLIGLLSSYGLRAAFRLNTELAEKDRLTLPIPLPCRRTRCGGGWTGYADGKISFLAPTPKYLFQRKERDE